VRGKKYIGSKYNLCVYHIKLPSGEYIYSFLYVNDMLIAFKSISAIDRLKKQLSFEFEMKELGKEKKVFDMKIERNKDSGKVCLTQKGYLQKVLQKFNINGNMKSVSTLLAPNFKFKATMSPSAVEESEYVSCIVCHCSR